VLRADCGTESKVSIPGAVEQTSAGWVRGGR